MDSGNNTIESTPLQPQSAQSEPQISRHVTSPSSNAIENNNITSQQVATAGKETSIIAKKWRKTSEVWKDFEEVQLADGVKKAMCLYCSEYPTANFYLAEVHRVKRVIDEATDSPDLFMNEMAIPMKEKFDKYWDECNLLMVIASILDPRIKFDAIEISFPLIYKLESEATQNVEKVKKALEELYLEYMELCKKESSSTSGEVNIDGIALTDTTVQQKDKGMQQMLNMIHQRHSVPPIKSKLETYLADDPYIPSSDSSSFCALEWWKNNRTKFKVLSRMATDILAVPISTVALKSTFSAGGKVIDEYHARLNEESIKILLCGGDWLRHKYGLKRK
ncbi:zinc finger BED domain-containing protein RICESLEEPER 2-like [Neltuma alba]|uniref:zinc finger BED domain-containing protein RICESLEEPER 2-like n=1 Tax=Neltuma alba TaxID=207710 RepID=UPI0010A34505|nr:zinc finger BED domain-containing protein RICESLEEPER 2-like [Prosopis alba]